MREVKGSETKHDKLTKTVPFETSHLLRSELNEVTLENIPVLIDINLNVCNENN